MLIPPVRLRTFLAGKPPQSAKEPTHTRSESRRRRLLAFRGEDHFSYTRASHILGCFGSANLLRNYLKHFWTLRSFLCKQIDQGTCPRKKSCSLLQKNATDEKSQSIALPFEFPEALWCFHPTSFSPKYMVRTPHHDGTT